MYYPLEASNSTGASPERIMRMDIHKVKILTLLKLAECETCPFAYKERNDKGLCCSWRDTEDEKHHERCIKVKECGHWPPFMC